jgi:hypothetical protein
MCSLFTCHFISLVWQLRVGVRQWCMVFELLWMSIVIGWCCKWMWQMLCVPMHSYDILGAGMLWKPKEARILTNFIDQLVNIW